ncbi:unnamed protein product [Owenia fusiformis]|uniref:Uncharacterized protein n=1 Tax=Owenia fusiformis TaxID=6347 RepID=A0A8J1XY67_OWEFU|nr:unnamed protein product [Owenia fusiformis]
MFLPPSNIHYIQTAGKNNLMDQAMNQEILEIHSKKILENGDFPKIQVVEKGGHWFALNNSQLELCRKLEKEGKCSKVKIDILPLNQIPIDIAKMMIVTDDIEPQYEKGSSNKGYHKLDQADGDTLQVKSDSTSATSEEECETYGTSSHSDVETDSECDWSVDGLDDEISDAESEASDSDTDTDEERSSGDERESLL